jgi:hypothetical protein
MSLIRGVLLAGQFRTHHELNGMSQEDQRNTLIVELSGRSNQNNFQAFNDAQLADAGAVLVFLRTARIRDDAQLKTISIDDMRNILIVEIGAMTGMGRELQGLSNIDLVALGLGKFDTGITLKQNTFLRGVLLAGKFRTQHELNAMSEEDQRNTLIVELSGRSNQNNFQSFNSFELAGMGAVLVFLRTARIRDDAQLKTLSIDDMRNILIVEIDGQTHLGSRLQSLSNIDLVLAGLGVDPVFPVIAPPTYVFKVDSVEIRVQKADNDHSDSDWLSIIVSVGNPITKNVQTFSTQPIHIEGNIKTGNIIAGNFVSNPFIAEDSDLVTVTYLLMNLGSSDAEEQFAQAVKVTNKVVGVVAPIAGAVIGFWLFGQPGEGFEVGIKISKAVDTVVSTLSDVFDFLGIHIGPPNCNGEVLHDTLTYPPGALAQAVNHPASREYTGPQEEGRCGGAPESKVNFTVLRSVTGGLITPNP